MKEEVQKYIDRFDVPIIELFMKIRDVIYGLSLDIEEELWANMPTYKHGSNFVRLIAFKDHINVNMSKGMLLANKQNIYQITPKGMMKIFLGEKFDDGLLKEMFINNFND